MRHLDKKGYTCSGGEEEGKTRGLEEQLACSTCQNAMVPMTSEAACRPTRTASLR